MRLTLITLSSLALFPLFSFAAVYEYVTVDGMTVEIEASSQAEALSNSASTRLPGSGVILLHTSESQLYQYVSVTGDVMSIMAATSEDAILRAPNIAPTSGVLSVEEADGPLPPSLDVPIDPTPP